MKLTIQRGIRSIILPALLLAQIGPEVVAEGLETAGFEGAPGRTWAAHEWLVPADRWDLIRKTPLMFPTFHPQGLVKIGDRFLLSSVEVMTRPLITPGGRTPGSGVGHIFEFSRNGELLRSVKLAEGDCYHPGGIDFDGVEVWIPVAEYRPDSRSIVYRLDPTDMTATVAFRVDDHIGGVAADRASGIVYGISWGSRRLYAWTMAGERLWVSANPSFYIEYQDCKWAGSGLAVCSGLESYPVPGKGRLDLGGVEIVDLAARQPLRQVPVPLFSEKGRVMTQNPFAYEVKEGLATFYFVPDDDESVLYEWQLQEASENEVK